MRHYSIINVKHIVTTSLFDKLRNDSTKFIKQVDLWRSWGMTWAQIDEAFGVCYQRSRRVYKAHCSRVGILDDHAYRDCRSL